MPYVAQVEIEVRVPIGSGPYTGGLFDVLPGIPQIFHVGDTIDTTVFTSGDLAILIANGDVV